VSVSIDDVKDKLVDHDIGHVVLGALLGRRTRSVRWLEQYGLGLIENLGNGETDQSQSRRRLRQGPVVFFDLANRQMDEKTGCAHPWLVSSRYGDHGAVGLDNVARANDREWMRNCLPLLVCLRYCPYVR